jgi:hypothetical protein
LRSEGSRGNDDRTCEQRAERHDDETSASRPEFRLREVDQVVNCEVAPRRSVHKALRSVPSQKGARVVTSDGLAITRGGRALKCGSLPPDRTRDGSGRSLQRRARALFDRLQRSQLHVGCSRDATGDVEWRALGDERRRHRPRSRRSRLASPREGRDRLDGLRRRALHLRRGAVRAGVQDEGDEGDRDPRRDRGLGTPAP